MPTATTPRYAPCGGSRWPGTGRSGPAGRRPGLTHLGADQGFPGRSRHLGRAPGPMAQASKRSVLPYLLLVLVGLVGLALPPFAVDAAHGLAVAALVAGALGLIVGRRGGTDADEAPAVATHTAPPAPAAAASDNTKELFEDSPNGIVVTDATGALVDTNQAFATLVGRTPEELAGTPLTALTAEGQDGLHDHLQTASEDGRAES